MHSGLFGYCWQQALMSGGSVSQGLSPGQPATPAQMGLSQLLQAGAQ